MKKSEIAPIVISLLTLLPFVATVLLGFGRGSPTIVATVTGLALLAASFELAWGTESLQFVISQVLALAILATVQVLPEYSIDAVLSFNGAFDPTQLHFATASMTGANRLLIGAGWPIVFLISYITSRKNPTIRGSLRLEREQAVEIL